MNMLTFFKSYNFTVEIRIFADCVALTMTDIKGLQ